VGRLAARGHKICNTMSRHPTRVTPRQQQALSQIVGSDRSRFDYRERRLYSHDTSVLPAVMRLLAGRNLADGVVRPVTEQEVVELVRFAQAECIPLVPRGKGTSGYGGAVPTDGGLVVDLCGLREVIRCDQDSLTVTVGAGIVWKDLESALSEQGLALRLYPTSAPASTVGGWLAQGGAGIGSHAYGWFAENVRAARVVTGSGEVRELVGAALDAIADAEGTTGIITQVMLDVRRAAEQTQIAIAWADPGGLAEALGAIQDANLPVWSIHFVNPTMARLKNAGQPVLAEGRYTAVIVYETSHAPEVEDDLRSIVAQTQGEWQPDELAMYEWAERYKPMRLKRLGPSLVPVEIVVPRTRMVEVLRDLDERIHAPLAIEGLSVRGDELVLLGFVPHDERKLGYTAGYGFSITAIRVAEAHAGRAYSTGRFFGSRAKQILGDDKVAAIRRTRLETDPAGVMNPGKVIFADGASSKLVSAALAVEPAVRGVANRVGRPAEPVERPAPNKRFLADVAGHAYSCAQCAYCVDVCPQFQESGGWESSGPRGKWFLLKDVLEGREHFDNQLTDIFGLCVECGKCDEACQLELPNTASWRKVKSHLWQGLLTRTS
jgi:FAD/FMN-containing dehydrogenase